MPTSPINAYFHPSSTLDGLELKGINYPVESVHLQSAKSGDLNHSGLIESGFLGFQADPNLTGQTINDVSYFLLDDIWRLMCTPLGPLLQNAYFPLTHPSFSSFSGTGIGIWGVWDDPVWDPTPLTSPTTRVWMGARWDNASNYWLDPVQHWSAFEVADPTNFQFRCDRVSRFVESPTLAEYPLLGGRGVACHLANGETTVRRWARPLPYVGRVRRDVR